MIKREEFDFLSEQNRRYGVLFDEINNGVIKRDILPNTAQPLQGEVEAVYFSKINRFFSNSISHMVMSNNQDIKGVNV